MRLLCKNDNPQTAFAKTIIRGVKGDILRIKEYEIAPGQYKQVNIWGRRGTREVENIISGGPDMPDQLDLYQTLSCALIKYIKTKSLRNGKTKVSLRKIGSRKLRYLAPSVTAAADEPSSYSISSSSST